MSIPEHEIHVLPRLVIDQIAAGEVVERPAAVVRELLDNAIDARATRIEVVIEAGGRGLIRVSDDGAGIRYDELPLAFASHATSKLRDVADLVHIATMGFRGEALASIGAVSRARIRSAVAGAPHAGELENEGGALSAPRPAARARGTDVEVRDLFFNVPARRAFLKKDSTETGHCVEAAVRLALAHPEVGFRVVADGRVALDAPPAEGALDGESLRAARLERVRRALGSEAAADLRPLAGVARGVTVDGFIGGMATARGDVSGIHLFVNGRFVRDRGVIHAVRDASRDWLGARQPTAFLFVSMDPAMVDVNVHPAKLEVRFRDASAVMSAIHGAVRRAYEGAQPVEPGGALLGASSAAVPSSHAWARRDAASDAREPEPQFGAAREDAAAAAPALPWTTSDGAAEPVKFLRIAMTFIVAEAGDGVDLYDQHALHERVQFERLRAQVSSGGVVRQGLLVPDVIELAPADVGLVEEHANAWREFGLDVERFGPVSVAVRAVPAALRRLRTAECLEDLLVLAREGKGARRESLVEETLHRMACRASVMAGDVLGDEEILALLRAARALPSAQTCPHGRPARIRLSHSDLIRAFERG